MKSVQLSEEVLEWLRTLAVPWEDKTPNDTLERHMRECPGGRATESPRPSILGMERTSVDELMRRFVDALCQDLRRETGDNRVRARLQANGKRFSLESDRVFANLYPFGERKPRAKVEVPSDLVARSGLNPQDCDHHLPNGWYTQGDSCFWYIPWMGDGWNEAKYQQVLVILVSICGVR